MDSYAPYRLVALDVPDAGLLHVLLVAADPLARAGLAALLNDREGYEVAGVMALDDDYFHAVDTFAPDVVLWDLGASGMDMIPDWSVVEVPVVALVPDESFVQDALAAGARALLLRDTDPQAIAATLIAAREGLFVFDAPLVDVAIPFRDETPTAIDLTSRERQVLALLAEGLSNKLIAIRLGITPNTVKFHVASVLSKLGAHSRTEAVTRAARLGYTIF